MPLASKSPAKTIDNRKRPSRIRGAFHKVESKMRRCLPAFVFLAFSAMCAHGAEKINQFIGFGDSTLDSGYFRYASTGGAAVDSALAIAVKKGAKGGFAGNGVMSSTILADKFGLTAVPSSAPGGGSNYANGGSLTATDSEPAPGNVSAIQQIRNYLASVHGKANPNALYVISSGNNDLSHSASDRYLTQSANALGAEVAALQKAGARTIVVPNSFLYAVYATKGGGLNSDNSDAYRRSFSYGQERWASLENAGVHFIPADLDSTFKYVVRHPSLFGFTSESVLAANAPAYGGSALLACLPPAQQQTYLFIDGKHLTTAGQTIEADYIYSLLIAPSQISLIAESSVQIGLNRASTIQRQIERFDGERGPTGINVWVNSGADALRINNAAYFPHISGIPFGGTLGVDYLTPIGILVGAAFTGGSETQHFSSGGNFKQTDESLSLYAGYKHGPIWANAVASYGWLQDQVARPVKLGIYTDQNYGKTSGQDLLLALRGGWDFCFMRITTGPVVGAVAQRIDISGFTETGTSGVTALSFGAQTRYSLLSQIGWRFAVDIGKWQPFAEATWIHEWADKDRTITASLTTTEAPSYSLSAAPIASNWAYAAVGSTYKVTSQVTLQCALTAQCFNPQVITYGGNLGVTVSF
ncbi:MAG: autotransporter domain-containing protein [Verrucomicrobiota bacterium]